MALINATRQRVENLGNFARALTLIPPGAVAAMNGAKTDGIDSLARQVARAIPLAGNFAKAHGKVLWVIRPDLLPPVLADWAAAAEFRRNADGFLTGPGMFSRDAADPGSIRLAAHLGPTVHGRVADLGAGWGWLAKQALDLCPGITRIDLHEAEDLALNAARRNVTDSRAAFHWTDVTALGRDAGPCDWVLMNPPFHQCRAADPDLGAAFIAAAARILKPSGRLLMVSNRQLPYEAPIAAHFRNSERLFEDSRFKVFSAANPLGR